MPRERTLIVGASLAGTRAAGALRQAGYDGDLVMIGDELALPYQRPPLSKEVLGASPPSADELLLEARTWYAEQGIELWLGTRAVALDAARRHVALGSVDSSESERVRFDRLLIATGAAPRPLDVPGHDLPGVVSLRTLDDARVLAAELAASERIVVIGGGLIGLEVAAAARTAGRAVTVVERGAAPLTRISGPALGERVARLHRERSVDLRCGADVVAISETGGGLTVHLSTGDALAADAVVVAIGVAPSTGWLDGSGVRVDDGVLVDEHGETSVPEIYAAGDVARAWNPRFGVHLRSESFAAAHDHGVAVGRAMAGVREPYAPIPGAGSVQYGVRIQAIGRVLPGDEAVVRGPRTPTHALGFYLRAGVVVGAFAVGRPREFLAARRLVAAGARVAPERLSDEASPLAELS